jgi:two-component system NarL family sensor kinase
VRNPTQFVVLLEVLVAAVVAMGALALYFRFVALRERERADRSAADERGRIARELHDTTLQTMIGLEMTLLAKTGPAASSHEVLACATYVRDTLRTEIVTLRELMHAARPLTVTGGTLPSYLSDLVRRFQSDTGINATFVCDAAANQLSPIQCADIVRVAQEALVNVRKHSGATAVTLRLRGHDDGITLRVDDNGRGFAFAGRLDNDALWYQAKGPLVIKERARAIGGRVSVESTPGRGASVEMSVPYAC